MGWLARLLVGYTPSTGLQIYATLLVNFSLPTWMYFAASDGSSGGATLGKRCFKIYVSRKDGARLGWLHALFRTAVKLLPWELAHVSAFGLAEDLGNFSLTQNFGIAMSVVLSTAYLGFAILAPDHQGVHDLVVTTLVRRKDPDCENP